MNIKDRIREAFSLKNEIAEKEIKYETHKEKIQDYFDKRKNIGKMIVDDKISVQKKERVYVTYFANELKKKLKKEIFKKISRKKYFISDPEGLFVLLKKAGISPNKVKKYIKSEIEIDKDALKNCFDIGEISLKDIDKCYDAKIVKYIEIKEKKGDSD